MFDFEEVRFVNDDVDMDVLSNDVSVYESEGLVKCIEDNVVIDDIVIVDVEVEFEVGFLYFYYYCLIFMMLCIFLFEI